MKVDNSKVYSKPDKICPICGIPLNVRTVLHNMPENCEEYITYSFMEIGQSMHMECYIQHVIDTYLKKKLNE